LAQSGDDASSRFSSAEQRQVADRSVNAPLIAIPGLKNGGVEFSVIRVWRDRERGHAQTAIKHDNPTRGFGRGWRATKTLRVVSVDYLYY
jgi:hypothetical protein